MLEETGYDNWRKIENEKKKNQKQKQTKNQVLQGEV